LFRLAIGKTLPPDAIDSTGIGSEIHPFAIVRPRRDLGTSASFFDPRIAMTIYVAIPAYFALMGMSGNRGAELLSTSIKLLSFINHHLAAPT
jgi:hypothetical protein